MIRKEGVRNKERSDKKRDVRPTIASDLYDFISDLSYVTNTPIKKVSEHLCIEGMKSKRVVEHISQHLRRPYVHGNTFYQGFLDRKPYKPSDDHNEKRKRLGTVRFNSHDYENLSSLSYALDINISSGVGLILAISAKDIDIINNYILNTVNYTLDENKKRVLKNLYKYVYYKSPFKNSISLLDIASYIYNKILGKEK